MAKQARALRTYDRVLDAAAYEFARYGYANANLQNIADRIGLTKGALYGHFSNKDELAAAFDDHLSFATESLLIDARTSSAPAVDRMRSLVLAMDQLLRTDARANAAFRLAIEKAQAAAVPVALLKETRQVALQLVREMQQEGQWDDTVLPEAVADLMMAAFFGTYWAGFARSRDEPDSTVAAIWNTLAHAFLSVAER